MRSLRFLLFPFAFIYWIISSIRNVLFDLNVFRSHEIPGRSIIVGNLSVGGTGKSPHVDYLIRLLKEKNIVPVTLSRGYGRSTKGLVVADTESTAKLIGDEPLMYKSNHPDVHVVVCEDRWQAVQHIRRDQEEAVIILDDAFQHRKVKGGLNILITDFNKPFYSDFILPVGNLRESRSGKKRADIIVVSKCPEDIDESAMTTIRNRINTTSNVFFSSIHYSPLVPLFEGEPDEIEAVLLVSGIANPFPLKKHLEQKYTVEHVRFSDHHDFSSEDIDRIHKIFDTFASRKKAIVTTEKDLMRLKKYESVRDRKYQWHFQPIEIKFKEEEKFNTLINTYANHI